MRGDEQCEETARRIKACVNKDRDDQTPTGMIEDPRPQECCPNNGQDKPHNEGEGVMVDMMCFLSGQGYRQALTLTNVHYAQLPVSTLPSSLQVSLSTEQICYNTEQNRSLLSSRASIVSGGPVTHLANDGFLLILW